MPTPPPDEAKKRLQQASPEKQTGVRRHDKKRRNTAADPSPNVEEPEAEPTMSFTSPPTPILPASETTTHIAEMPEEWQQDGEGDTTMVDHDSPSPSPNAQLDGTPRSSNGGVKASDPAWIIRRTKLATTRQTEEPGLDPLQTPHTGQAPNPPHTTQKGRTPPRLPTGLIRTQAPVGGFPEVHLSTPPWYNLRPEQRAHFDNYPEPKLWVRSWQGSKLDDLVITSENMKALILKMTGERARLSSPQQEKPLASAPRFERQKPPYHFLVSNVSERAYEIMLNNNVISTSEMTAFFLPYTPPVPRFLCTIEGFSLSVRDDVTIRESEEEVTRIVHETLLSDDAFIAAVKSRLVGDTTSQHDMEPAAEIVSTIEIRHSKPEVLANPPRKQLVRKSLWNLYFRRYPNITWPSYFLLLQSLRNTTFADMDFGCATLVAEERRLHCFKCKGADHELFNCPYSDLEGWMANEGKELEETAEFAHSNRSQNDQRGRRGYSRGRGRGYGGRFPNHPESNSDRW